MRALSHCDFCGADAAGTFELLPPELEPTEAEQRRVVLCRTCGDRLEDLLEPLLARAGVESSEEPTSGSDSDAVTEADDSSSCGDASGVEPTAEDPDRTGRPSVIDVSEAKADAVADDSDRGDSGADDRDRGITLERSPDSESEDTEDISTESSNIDESSTTDAPSSTDEQRDSSDTGEDSSSSNSSNSNANSKASPPQGYGKVIRLLRNREFPMDRSAVETLAAGAYDLETREVEAIIEHALEDGEFAENGDQLVRS
ncbi:hypothetical protein [Halostagnicola sp. A-GB9-2]|uniref:hypothetical protein n=1 Tax=Halostagnicola sp. A-GB9-2 TaxID=3048066 RepID=UPI0024C00ED7|nr:hypothetical protein [Halostagnicola sp. A-GB9-2]MDJ1432831.1 hypothetical protein [Halostagnicola sp. A-GB9-2]